MPARFWDAMTCPHDGFHGIRSRYDSRRGVLVYFWTCERCGTRLGEVRRQEYRPRFDPHGNDRHAAPVR